jgi:hypothetical protein
VAVIGENLWRRKFAADPAIAGKRIRLSSDGDAKQSVTAVGVVSRRENFPEWADFWMPLSLCWNPMFRTGASTIRSK